MILRWHKITDSDCPEISPIYTGQWYVTKKVGSDFTLDFIIVPNSQHSMGLVARYFMPDNIKAGHTRRNQEPHDPHGTIN